ncbi:MAG: FG-GAP repeat protein, partial [Planctomycetota bacterium]
PGVEPDAVYVFDALTGQELHKLFASDGADEDGLGREVAIDGGLVLSGAAGDDDSGNRSGSAYVFDAVTSVELAKLTASDAAAGDAFGTSVAIEGNRAVVGAPRNEDNGPSSGSVYVFDARSGQELMKLVPADGLTGDTFGEAVAIEGGRILVGAPQSDELADRSGSVYVFDLATGAQLAKFTASDGGETHFFGSCLAAQRDVVAVGAPFADGSEPSEGAAYLFDLDGGPDGVVSYCEPTTPNAVSTTGALLTSTGGFGTSNATFNVSAVPNNFGLLFGGDAQTSVVLGCGTRCVGGAIVRGPIEMAVNNQVLGATFDMATFGSTDVQYWFRDAGSCGAGSNLSNALTR